MTATETETAEVRREFRDRFTVFPDSGIIELHCFRCEPGEDRWPVGYHPSLDFLIEQARAHDHTKHGTTAAASSTREQVVTPAGESNGWLRRDNGTTWPDPADPREVEWKLRYGTPDSANLLWAAAVIHAYKHLMERGAS